MNRYLTLDDALQKAMATHPDIQRLRLQVDKSRSGVRVARSDYLPHINLYGEYDPIKTYALPANGIFHTKERDGWIASASLHQKIWDFSKTTANMLQYCDKIMNIEDKKVVFQQES